MTIDRIAPGRKHVPIVRRAAVDELIERSGGGPIYVTTNVRDFNRPFSATPITSLRASYPSTEFIWARGLYKNTSDWRHRWRIERDRYTAMIIISFGAWGGDPYSGILHEHTIGNGTWCEICSLKTRDRPILWQANEHPAVFDIPQFSVVPLPEMTNRRAAQLMPDLRAKPFAPVLYSLFSVTRAGGVEP